MNHSASGSAQTKAAATKKHSALRPFTLAFFTLAFLTLAACSTDEQIAERKNLKGRWVIVEIVAIENTNGEFDADQLAEVNADHRYDEQDWYFEFQDSGLMAFNYHFNTKVTEESRAIWEIDAGGRILTDFMDDDPLKGAFEGQSRLHTIEVFKAEDGKTYFEFSDKYSSSRMEMKKLPIGEGIATPETPVLSDPEDTSGDTATLPSDEPVVLIFDTVTNPRQYSHDYGAGDCFGNITRFQGDKIIALDQMSCGDYGYTNTRYWLNSNDAIEYVVIDRSESVVLGDPDTWSYIITERHMDFTVQPPIHWQRIDTFSIEEDQTITKPFAQAALPTNESTLSQWQSNYMALWQEPLNVD